jgi:hypothetical protein
VEKEVKRDVLEVTIFEKDNKGGNSQDFVFFFPT